MPFPLVSGSLIAVFVNLGYILKEHVSTFPIIKEIVIKFFQLLKCCFKSNSVGREPDEVLEMATENVQKF